MEDRGRESALFASTLSPEFDSVVIGKRPRRKRVLPASIVFFLIIGIEMLYFTTSNWLSGSSITKVQPSLVHGPGPITVSLKTLSTPQDEPKDGGPSFRIHVTLTNTSPSTVVFLNWWSPFASAAASMGVFNVIDVYLGTRVKCLDTTLDYSLPSSHTFTLEEGEDSNKSLQKIKSGESVSKEVEVGVPSVQVKLGREYSVKATGKWIALWVGENDDGKYVMKDATSDLEFESESVDVLT